MTIRTNGYATRSIRRRPNLRGQPPLVVMVLRKEFHILSNVWCGLNTGGEDRLNGLLPQFKSLLNLQGLFERFHRTLPVTSQAFGAGLFQQRLPKALCGFGSAFFRSSPF